MEGRGISPSRSPLEKHSDGDKSTRDKDGGEGTRADSPPGDRWPRQLHLPEAHHQQEGLVPEDNYDEQLAKFQRNKRKEPNDLLFPPIAESTDSVGWLASKDITRQGKYGEELDGPLHKVGDKEYKVLRDDAHQSLRLYAIASNLHLALEQAPALYQQLLDKMGGKSSQEIVHQAIMNVGANAVIAFKHSQQREPTDGDPIKTNGDPTKMIRKFDESRTKLAGIFVALHAHIESNSVDISEGLRAFRNLDKQSHCELK